MSIKPPSKPTSTIASNFIAGGVGKTLTSPRTKARNFASEDPEIYVKAMFFGSPGTGKTWVVKSLLELGFKVLVVTTDVGGDGLNAIIIPMRREGTWEKFRHNLRSQELTGYEEVKAFFKDPENFEGLEDLYQWDPDFIFWDGLSGWQQVDVSQYVGDMTPERSGAKGVSDARESGLQFEQADWGQIRNATVRGVDDFCGIRNKLTGKPWHKIVTCHEAVKSKGASGGGGFVEAKEPLLQGAGGRIIIGAFDLVIRCTAKSDLTDEDGSKRIYEYVFPPNQNLVAKVRGYEFPPRMIADPKELITSIFKQMGVALPIVAGLPEPVLT